MKFGIIGYGRIAKKFVQSIENTTEGEIYAIGSRSLKERSDEYINNHPNVVVYNDYNDLLNDEKVEAVYVALPHKLHKTWIIEAMKHHKAVLSEKPIVLSIEDINEIISVNQEYKSYCLEALKTKFNDGLNHLKEDIKLIGDIQTINANFCFDATSMINDSYLFDPTQGGAFNDVGTYLLGFVLALVDSNITDITSTAKMVNDIDYHFETDLLFENGVKATIEGAIDRNKERYALIQGTNGSIMVPNFNRVIDYTIDINNEKTTKHYPIHGDDMTMEIQALIDDVNNKLTQSKIHSLNDSKEIIEISHKIKESFKGN